MRLVIQLLWIVAIPGCMALGIVWIAQGLRRYASRAIGLQLVALAVFLVVTWNLVPEGPYNYYTPVPALRDSLTRAFAKGVQIGHSPDATLLWVLGLDTRHIGILHRFFYTVALLGSVVVACEHKAPLPALFPLLVASTPFFARLCGSDQPHVLAFTSGVVAALALHEHVRQPRMSTTLAMLFAGFLMTSHRVELVTAPAMVFVLAKGPRRSWIPIMLGALLGALALAVLVRSESSGPFSLSDTDYDPRRTVRWATRMITFFLSGSGSRRIEFISTFVLASALAYPALALLRREPRRAALFLATWFIACAPLAASPKKTIDPIEMFREARYYFSGFVVLVWGAAAFWNTLLDTVENRMKASGSSVRPVRAAVLVGVVAASF